MQEHQILPGLCRMRFESSCGFLQGLHEHSVKVVQSVMGTLPGNVHENLRKHEEVSTVAGF